MTTNGAPGGFNTTPKDPPLVGLYGDSGSGKTTSLLFAWPRAEWVVPKGGIKPASFVGYRPPTIYDNIHFIDDIIPIIDKVKTGALVIDDFSYLVANTADLYAEKYRIGPSGKANKFYRWEMLGKVLRLLRFSAREAGIAVGVDAHPAPPGTDIKGNFQKGSMKVPGQARQDLPVVFDIIGRAIHDSTAGGFDPATGLKNWPYLLLVDPDDPSWYTKDRDSIIKGRLPLNVGEVLRAAGYSVPRAPGMEWQDEVVEAVATALLSGADRGAIFKEGNAIMREKYLKGQPLPRQLAMMRWTWYDALARTKIREQRLVEMRAFGLA